jgi:hypothetical protein
MLSLRLIRIKTANVDNYVLVFVIFIYSSYLFKLLYRPNGTNKRAIARKTKYFGYLLHIKFSYM